jgi:hypothetical protein
VAVGDDRNRLAAQDVVFLTRALSAAASESRAVTEVFRGKLRQAPNGDWVFTASTDQNGVVGFVLGSVAPSWTSSESSTTGIQSPCRSKCLYG